MAGPTSALDAIKQIQTVLDDEKRSMTDGAHLRLSDAALAAFNEVKALARFELTFGIGTVARTPAARKSRAANS